MTESYTPLPPMHELIGATIGGVTIEEVLAFSERAIVCRGTQHPIGRRVVLKLLPALSDDPEVRAAQLREVQVLSRLRHPNVVTLYNVGLHEDRFPYHITEYVLGGTLRAAMDAEEPFTPSRALGIIAQVASAIEEIHNQGMVHRKIAPENLLLEELVGSKQELVKVSGFGLTALPHPGGLGALADEFTSPTYLAPEQVTGAEVSPLTDIYSCGVLLYEMLTGGLPYEATTPPDLWDEILQRTPPPLSGAVAELGMHAPLQHIINRLLAKKPEARLPTARKLRLLAIRLREDILTINPESSRSNDQFPVLVTAARLRALPLDSDYDLDEPDAETMHDLDELVGSANRRPDDAEDAEDAGWTSPAFELVEAEEEAPPPVAAVDPADIEALRWLTLVAQRVERATGHHYLILAATSHAGNRLTARFADGAEILMDASLPDGTRLVAVVPPIHPERWLKRLSQRALLDHLCIGVARALDFPGVDGTPSAAAASAAVLAARLAQPGQLLADDDSIHSLAMDGAFVSGPSHATPAFKRYVGG